MKSIWKGAIGFGLVNIPVKLYSAVQNSNLDLDMLDSKDMSKIKYQRISERSGKEVPFDRIVKGFMLNESYVVLEDEDFESAMPEKNKLIELENFVDISAVNPIYYETSYYTQPEPQGKKAYALLLKALQKSKKAGIARFVLRSSEHLCVIHPLGNMLVVTRIRFDEEIRSPKELEIDAPTVKPKELEVGMALIKQYSSDFDISAFKDEYSKELMKIIRAKAKGKKTVVKKMRPEKRVSDDLYEQLMQSLNKKGA
ncbi:non-homologous end joining protein Ku [Nubsella zeaxanthinifaciens]|uniref:non-homologous end joining protein Ku n=1 Tax=Nubsella zeaxanthinifaciens TaxID=392412 RepID=UPI000DE3430E|nr:Ku protein [Nubsella zeaxanthinifaciens]